MSDTEIIIQLLKNVEWRIRANRVRQELVLGLLIVLILLITLKIWDLFSPLSGNTILYIMGASAFLYAGYVVSRFQQKGTLAEAALSLDRKAGLNDEIRTALWFINNRHSSDWVDQQIRRAAKDARHIDLTNSYPGMIPRNSYVVAGMVLLFVGLNFVPLPLNHNWLMLEAAPAVGSSANELSDLDGGEGLRKVSSLSQPASGEALDEEAVSRGLEEIARDLLQSDELRAVAEAILDEDLPQAAEQLRRVASNMGTDTPAAAQNMLNSFRDAAQNVTPGLEQLTKGLNDLSEAIADRDEAAAEEAVEQVAEELERLDGELQTSETAGQQIARGMQSQAGAEATQVRQAGESPQARSDSMGLGASTSKESGQGKLPETTLDAQIEIDIQTQQTGLKGLEDEAILAPVELEEASRRERSRLDYRNVKSELTAAQKDVLNKDSIPWEYRPLIKGYFEAIRPPIKK